MKGGATIAAMNLRRPATVEDLMQTPEDGRKYELVDGQILVSPGGYRHSMVGTKIVCVFGQFLTKHPIAKVCGADLGIARPNGNLRSPDVTVVRNEKLALQGTPDGFMEVIPDLAVEVLSPSDSLTRVSEKVGEFLECGVALVWVVDPQERTVAVYRSLSNTQHYTVEDTITAEPVLPGFSCPVSDFFQFGG
jgi:Uma2 family endonuclease